MTEKEELNKMKNEMEKKKLKIEVKYGKLAKRRLTEINKIINKNKLILDMSDDEFKSFLKMLNNKMIWVRNAQNQQRNQQ